MPQRLAMLSLLGLLACASDGGILTAPEVATADAVTATDLGDVSATDVVGVEIHDSRPTDEANLPDTGDTTVEADAVADTAPLAPEVTDAGADTPDVPVCGKPPACSGLKDTPTDLDKDGCLDACCVSECPTDFVVADYDKDGCGDGCGDAPCTKSADCKLYVCAFYGGQCTTPKGICSNGACFGAGPVCGCDGKTYETGCEANKAGVPVSTSGPCP